MSFSLLFVALPSCDLGGHNLPPHDLEVALTITLGPIKVAFGLVIIPKCWVAKQQRCSKVIVYVVILFLEICF